MATSKIQKPSGEVDKFEESVSQALVEIESAKTDIRPTLRELYITGAKELDVGAKKAVVIYVPVRQIRGYQKIQVNLVRELEKKFSGKTVVFLGQRRILPKPKKNQRTRQKQLRPRSRTLTAVHDAILDDLVFPAEIVGKRTRVKLDGTKLMKVHLDRSQQTNIEHKVNVFAGVYKQLTGKDVTFEFPVMD